MNIRNLSRRALIVSAAICGVAGLRSAAAENACGTENAPNQGKRESLHYTDMSTDMHKICDVCMYFTGANGCGTCRLLKGPVDPAGTCDSWKELK